EDGIRDFHVTGVQTCALPISILYRLLVRRVMDGHQRAAQYFCAALEEHVRKQIQFAAFRQGDTAAHQGQIRHGRTLYQRKAALRSEERRVGKESRWRWW